ncbi:MAG: AMP-dependent synthetase [Ruminococcaceae bacterium]|nr:AMP-dependent synthetase [Oscillospiraceae bacterium]
MKKTNYPLYTPMKFDNFKELITLAAEKEEKVAFKYRYEKEILEVSYKDFKTEVDSLAKGIMSENLDLGNVAILGENSYRWINIFLSLLCTRGTAVPVDKDLPEDQMLYVLDTSDCDVIFYSETFDEFVKKHESVLSKVKKFVKFKSDEPSKKWVEGDTKEKFITLESLFVKGKNQKNEEYKNLTFDKDDIKLIVFTSGTTGTAKGVMLTVENISTCINGGLSLANLEGTCLSVLPYHHTYASVCDILGGIDSHVTICINENIRSVPLNLKTFKPDYMFLVPRYLEVFHERILKEAERTGKLPLLQKMIKVSNSLLKVGIDMRGVFFKSVREAFGGNVKALLSGGALLRPDLGDFFESIGIPVVIGYGITECSPLVCANRNEFYDVRTIGLPLPNVELEIDSPNEEGIGEIKVKSSIVMKGYYKNEEATREVIKDGWFYTGDYGKINELGQVSITGRKKNIIVLSNGKNVYPEEIETYIATIPAVEEVVVYSLENDKGDETALCAEIYMNPENVEKLGLKKAADKIKYITEEVRQVLYALPSYKQIRKIVIRDREFEKTTTKKIKRNLINKQKA